MIINALNLQMINEEFNNVPQRTMKASNHDPNWNLNIRMIELYVWMYLKSFSNMKKTKNQDNNKSIIGLNLDVSIVHLLCLDFFYFSCCCWIAQCYILFNYLYIQIVCEKANTTNTTRILGLSILVFVALQTIWITTCSLRQER